MFVGKKINEYMGERSVIRPVESSFSAIFPQSRLMRKTIPFAGLDWASAPVAIQVNDKTAMRGK
jgi:hypothetical protein